MKWTVFPLILAIPLSGVAQVTNKFIFRVGGSPVHFTHYVSGTGSNTDFLTWAWSAEAGYSFPVHEHELAATFVYQQNRWWTGQGPGSMTVTPINLPAAYSATGAAVPGATVTFTGLTDYTDKSWG